MTWLIDTPINYWLLACCMFGIWSFKFPLALFGSGYAQTVMPTWMKRAFAAYYFPVGLLEKRLEKRPVSPLIRRLVDGLMLLNVLINLAVAALPFERFYSLAGRAIHELF